MSSPTWSGGWLHSPIPLLLNPLPSPSCAQSAATLGILAVFPHTVLLHLPSCRAVVPEWGTPFHRCIIIVSPIPPLRWYLRHHSDHSMLWSQICCICFAYDNYIYVCEALPKVSVEVVLMMGDKSLVPLTLWHYSQAGWNPTGQSPCLHPVLMYSPSSQMYFTQSTNPYLRGSLLKSWALTRKASFSQCISVHGFWVWVSYMEVYELLIQQLIRSFKGM